MGFRSFIVTFVWHRQWHGDFEVCRTRFSTHGLLIRETCVLYSNKNNQYKQQLIYVCMKLAQVKLLKTDLLKTLAFFNF